MILSKFINTVRSVYLHQVLTTDGTILDCINIGLAELYERFGLKHKSTIYTLTSANDYVLPVDFLGVEYITTPGMYYRNPLGDFTNTLKEDFELGINIEGDYNSVFITDYTSLKVPYPIVGQPITFNYIAKPVTVDNTMLALEIPIGSQFINPLLLYVAYLGTMQNEGVTQLDVDKLVRRYEAACMDIINSGMYITRSGLNSKLSNRGYV